MKRGRKSPDYRTQALLGAQCTDPWGEAAQDYQEPRQHCAPLRFVLGVGLWSIKGGWRSHPCSASLQSNCLFPRRLSKKDDIYQSLLSGDLGGRERGRVYCLWKQAKKMRKTLEGRKCFQTSKLLEMLLSHGEMALGLRPCSTALPLGPFLILTSPFSLAIPAFPDALSK